MKSDMKCKMCKESGQTWDGDAPTCYFETNGEDNWNCATINAIRDICYEGRWELPHGVSYQYCDDDKYSTICIDEIEEVSGMALWVAWYKSRGRTDALWIMDKYEAPRKPTESDLLAIINFYS